MVVSIRLPPSQEWFENWKRQQVAGGLTDILSGIKASFILIINDVPEIREIFEKGRLICNY